MTRQKEIREIHKRRHKLFYKWLGILVVIPASIFLASAIFFNIGAMFFDDEDHDDYRLNFGTEMMGVAASIVITSFIIDRLQANRDRERQTQDLKDRLVREARSRSNDIAISAVEWLRAEGWLTGDDGLLQGTRLRNANLRGVDLTKANLQRVDLSWANLQRANLTKAKLQGAILGMAELQGANLMWAFLQRAHLSLAFLQGAHLMIAKLQGADLSGADLTSANLQNAKLQGADLTKANLQGAILFAADLQGADLTKAKLQGANLIHVKLQEARSLHEVTLPDGNRYTDNIDIEKFTAPEHPEFMETLKKVNEIRREILQGLKL